MQNAELQHHHKKPHKCNVNLKVFSLLSATCNDNAVSLAWNVFYLQQNTAVPPYPAHFLLNDKQLFAFVEPIINNKVDFNGTLCQAYFMYLFSVSVCRQESFKALCLVYCKQ